LQRGSSLSASAYNLSDFPTNLVAGSNILITGTKQNPTISATDTPGLILVSNQVVSTISTLGSIAGTQGVHSASIAALYLTNDNTSQVIYGLFQSNSVVKTAVDYLAETQSVHTTSIDGLLQSNAEARVTLDTKLGTNGNGSALSGITANQVGAMSTSERTNYYTKAEGDLSAAAKVSISSGSATNLDLYADPQTFTGLTGSVTITNRAERPIVARGTGTVSLASTGPKQMRPVYLTLEGFSSVSVPGGYAVGGWGEWQTNQVNHFLVWTVSTNLFLNAITTSGE